MTDVSNFNNQSAGEEIFNAIVHGVGALLAIAGTTVLIVQAALYNDAWAVVASCLYGFSLIFLYVMSTLYHALTNRRAKKVFQIFDHCSIFILILGSYIPICLVLLRSTVGWVLFGLNALLAVLGIVANAVSLQRWHKVSLLAYLLMGWSVLLALRPLLEVASGGGLTLLVTGGLCYTVGVFFYQASRPRYMHGIWHLLVLAGSTFHYFFILLYIIR